jgi:serine/threonine protein kinase
MDCSQVNQALTLPGIGDLVDGRFRIDRKLGEGGTSTVYEVSHVITDKKFAIKWLLPELALEDAAVDRFIHEARVGGKFAHPHAVQVYDICKASDSFYMLMELLQGESVQTRLERDGRLSVQEACSIVLTCADVLAAAHRVGIIHRDLKPANIFLCKDGEDSPQVTKLLDFGISTFCSDLQNISLTSTPRGSVIGTPLYMSPEQMLGEQVDQRADIYALGAVLYELVSGQPPFQADSYGELVVKVTVEARPTPLRELAKVDRQFAAVVGRAMARKPADRFSTVEELTFALRPYAGPPDTSTVRTIASAVPLARSTRSELSISQTRPRFAPRRFGRSAWLTGVLAISGAALATFGTHWLVRSHDTVAADSTPALRSIVTLPPERVASPSSEADWERTGGQEVLTGRAAPDDMPVSTVPASKTHGRKSASTRRATSAPKPEEAAAPAVEPVSEKGTDAPRRAAPGPNVQLRRNDFRAAPTPSNTAPPRASVSRTDF